MAKAKLTKSFIDRCLPDPDGIDDFYDSELPGLFLRVRPTGLKVFYLFYRNSAGRGRNFKLGRYGTITAQQARELAKETMYNVSRGRDPASERISYRSAPTVSELAAIFTDVHVVPKLAPTSQREYRRLINRRTLPKFGAWKIREVKKSDILKWHSEMRDVPREANFALSVMSKLMSFAMDVQGLSDTNPCAGVLRYPERKRDKFLTEQQIRDLGSTLTSMLESETANMSSIRAIQLLALTGCRRSEVLSLKWQYVDFVHSCLNLPTSKTGQKRVPLAPPARELLEKIYRTDSSEWVFPCPYSNGHLKAIDSTWRKARDAAGLEGFRIHDLRHTFASIGASSGVSLAVLGKVLGQSHLATTQRYAHLYEDPVNLAAASIGNTINDVLRGSRVDAWVLKTPSK
jgi:integrase